MTTIHGMAQSRCALTLSDFRAAVADSFLPLHVSATRPSHFFGSIRTTLVEGMHITDVCAAEHIV